MQKIAFIVNPFSSKGNYQPLLEQLKKKVSNPLVYISDSISGTDEFIKNNWENVDVFVAIGGDGTISTVAKSIINSDKILGIIPAGSGNGFANETKFNIDLEELIKRLDERKFKEIDTFTVNDRLSINVAGVGFDGAVVEAFEKTSRGFKNYIKTSIKTFFNYKPIKISFEEQYKKYNGYYLMMNIANTRQFGNNAYIAPHASKSDGLVEIALVKRFPITHAATFAYRMFTKKLVENQYLKYISVPEIEFTVNSNLWHLDGEFNEIESPIKVKVMPKSLKILI